MCHSLPYRISDRGIPIASQPVSLSEIRDSLSVSTSFRPANLTTTHVHRSIDCALIKTRFKVKRNHVSFTLQRPKDYICECSLEQVHRLWAFERKLIRGWKQSGGG